MRRSQTAYIILGLLSIKGYQSGYDLHKTIKGSVGYFWSESYGQIYPTLKKLAAEGLIVPGKTSRAKPQRQTYSVTKDGRRRLREWLAAPYKDDPPRSEFLLKLFFGREAAPAVSMAHIREFQARASKMLASIAEVEKLGRERHGDHPHFPFWMLTVTFGLAQLRAALEWSESALAMLERQAAKQK
jgi:DNA-binding PadR family transcriptional regulator